MMRKKDTSPISPATNHAAPFDGTASLQGQLLIASPHIDDRRFHHSVIMMCQHDQSSAMGVVLNHKSEKIDIAQLCETLKIGKPRFHGDQPIHIGGPVEGSRGFVIHSQDHMRPESIAVTFDIGLTSSVNILRDIIDGIGPVHSIISLGYAGWHAGQLERELSENIWLNLPANSDLLFEVETNDLWDKAYATLGIDPVHYASGTGTA